MKCCAFGTFFYTSQFFKAVQSEIGESSPHHSFDELKLSCLFLCVDAVSDVADLWSPACALRVSEVRALLARRAEFSAREIAALSL